jgi:hypothetical protein
VSVAGAESSASPPRGPVRSGGASLARAGPESARPALLAVKAAQPGSHGAAQAPGRRAAEPRTANLGPQLPGPGIPGALGRSARARRA